MKKKGLSFILGVLSSEDEEDNTDEGDNLN